MYCMHAQKGASEAPRTRSEHVKPQHFLGACPQTPLVQSVLWAPLFVFALGPSHPLGGPGPHNHPPQPSSCVMSKQYCQCNRACTGVYMLSGVGHTGARALATRGCAPPHGCFHAMRT